MTTAPAPVFPEDVLRASCALAQHDGELLLCCADLHSRMSIGNLREARFSALWAGPVATRHRLAHLAGQFLGPCASRLPNTGPLS